MTTDEAFRKTVELDGQPFRDAERELLQGGPAAAATLRQNLNHPDPVAQLLARCLLDQVEGRKPEYQNAIDYLNTLESMLAETPITTPSPTGAVSYLKKHFGDRVAELLAVQLVKGTDWPHWRVMAVLFYLRDQKQPSTTAPLLRFAVATPNEEWRATAIEAIEAIQDPNLRAKVAAERARLRGLGRDLPNAIDQLAPVP
jgi:HEAT repeat protein